MAARLNQPSSVKDDGPPGCKLLLSEIKVAHALGHCSNPSNKHRLTPCQQPR